MKQWLIIWSGAVLLVMAAWGQGSGNVALAELGTQDSGGDTAFLVTRTMKGKIAVLQKNDRVTIVVVEDSQGRRGALTINGKTRFRAEKGTEYAGKKHISADDLAAGQMVKVTFVPDTGRVVELRITQRG